jgi:uncharacterized protein YecE (DUF72 family)
MAEVLVGTSGYSYEDWVGPVYPEGTPPREFLPLYAAEFPVVELNFTYYSQPKAAAVSRMMEKTPEGFRFAMKAHRTMTHEITEDLKREIAVFREGIAPLAGAGRLAAVLLQFPYSFAYTPENRETLSVLSGELGDLPLAVEFRKAEWMRDKVKVGLRERKIALVSVDEPDLPNLLKPVTDVTADFAYVRFHGRNAAKWWTGDNVSRYDYLYGPEELDEWTGRIKEILKRARMLMIFFNNHRRGMAVQNARQMREMLQQQGLAVR